MQVSRIAPLVVYLPLNIDDRLRHWALRRWHARTKPLPLESQL